MPPDGSPVDHQGRKRFPERPHEIPARIRLALVDLRPDGVQLQNDRPGQGSDVVSAWLGPHRTQGENNKSDQKGFGEGTDFQPRSLSSKTSLMRPAASTQDGRAGSGLPGWLIVAALIGLLAVHGGPLPPDVTLAAKGDA